MPLEPLFGLSASGYTDLGLGELLENPVPLVHAAPAAPSTLPPPAVAVVAVHPFLLAQPPPFLEVGLGAAAGPVPASVSSASASSASPTSPPSSRHGPMTLGQTDFVSPEFASSSNEACRDVDVLLADGPAPALASASPAVGRRRPQKKVGAAPAPAPTSAKSKRGRKPKAEGQIYEKGHGPRGAAKAQTGIQQADTGGRGHDHSAGGDGTDRPGGDPTAGLVRFRGGWNVQGLDHRVWDFTPVSPWRLTSISFIFSNSTPPPSPQQARLLDISGSHRRQSLFWGIFLFYRIDGRLTSTLFVSSTPPLLDIALHFDTALPHFTIRASPILGNSRASFTDFDFWSLG